MTSTPRTPFTELELKTATANYENQIGLLEQFYEAFKLSGIPVEDLAEQFGITVIQMEEILAGDYELIMSEMRMIANSLGVVISYTVEPAQGS